MTPSGDRARARVATRTAGSVAQTGPADIFPTEIRIDGGRRKQKIYKKSRLIITDDAVYVAASRDAGMSVDSVTKYPLPDGERKTMSSKNGSWGAFSWSPCGCGNSWGRHTKESLIARAER
jgi:hypothetical protein